MVRYFRIVGNQNQCFALRIQIIEYSHNLGAGRRIKVSGRFIGKNDEWIVNQSTGNGDPLLLAS